MLHDSATVREQWDRAAEGWDGQGAVIGPWLAAATEQMIGLAGVRPGDRVLDLAAGAGQQTLIVARRVGHHGSVLATDLAPALVARLRDRVARAGLGSVEARVADAQAPLVGVGRFDAAICRMALMLMPDPDAALRGVAAALSPGGRFCVMVFAEPEANPCIRILMATALRHAGLPPANPFAPGGLLSLGRPGDLVARFRDAGFRDVEECTVDAPFALPTAAAYVDFVRAAAAPVRAVLDRLDPDAQAAAWADIAAALADFETPGGWRGPNRLLLVSGRA